ncbi:MAG: PEP/pyruvate-binding domain-containing protein, partial [Nanoarchaeota archaeon]|nr:PEP/pyruvate-binding domain-containing protein [Nanoarchaeota archaeon]
IYSFRKVGESNRAQVGYKASSIGKILQSGLRTSPGFVIAADVFSELMKIDSLGTKIKSHLDRIDPDFSNVKEISNTINLMISNVPLPDNISEEITESYHSLGFDPIKNDASSLLKTCDVYVAVRPSPIDDESLGFTVGISTLLNVKGKDRLISSIKKIYASFFSPEIIIARKNKRLGFDEGVAIIIQKMINSDKSGTSYSVNIETENPNEIMIKACFGLGEAIVSKNVYPDVYLVDKTDLKVKAMKISDKEYEFILDRDREETVKHYLNEKSKSQVLDDKEIIEIARLTKRMSNTLSREQKMEWAISKENFYILQSKNLDEFTAGDKDETIPAPKERVEIEIIESEEEVTPDIIDIDDNYDIDEDLKALEEMENDETSLKEQLEEELLELDEDAKAPKETNYEAANHDDSNADEIKGPESSKTIFADESISQNQGENSDSEMDIDFLSDDMMDGPHENQIEDEINISNPEENTELAEDLEDTEREEDLVHAEEEKFILSSMLEDKEKNKTMPSEKFNFNKEPNQILEQAFFNAGNTIVACDMAIIAKLKKKIS